MLLSIVSTLYQSEPYIDEFIERTALAAEQITNDYEIILVDDGSPDHALEKALNLQKNYPALTIIQLSRNFGHHEAGLLGLAHAEGDYIFLIDSDLEEPPELLNEFWNFLCANPTIDSVFGIQEKRKGLWRERISGACFYWLFNRLSNIKIPANLLTVRLMKRELVKAVLEYPEKNLFLAGLLQLAGFNQQPIQVKKLSKPKSTYTLSKQVKLFVTSISAFSSKPLEYILLIGMVMLMLSFFTTAVYTFKCLIIQSKPIETWVIMLIALCFATGIMVSCTGILGIYLAKIYTEVKHRPRAIIKRIHKS